LRRIHYRASSVSYAQHDRFTEDIYDQQADD